MLKTKFQNVLKSVMHFENYVSTCFEIFDMVSACLEIFNIVFNTMVHNIGEFQNSTFDIFIPLTQRVV